MLFKLFKIIKINKEELKLLNKIFQLYLFILILRIIVIVLYYKVPIFIDGNFPIIVTDDGFYHATGIKYFLNPELYQNNLSLLNNIKNNGLSILGFILVKYFGLDIKFVYTYLPAIISSLVVIPIVFLFRLFEYTNLGFYAAALVGIGYGYYNRTFIGYFDTDMFNLLFPLIISYYLISFLKTQNIKKILLASIFISLYGFFYSSYFYLIMPMVFIFFIYLLIQIKKEDNQLHLSKKFNLFLVSFILLIIPFLKYSKDFSLTNIYINIFLSLFTYFLYKKGVFDKFKIEKKTTFFIYIFILFSILIINSLVFNGVFKNIFFKIANYILKIQVNQNTYFHFINPNITIQEATVEPWHLMFNRMTGTSLAVLLGLIGYFFLIKKHKEFLLFLPLLILGFLSFKGGIRFNFFASLPLFFGDVYLIYLIINKLDIKNKIFKNFAFLFLYSIFFIPNLFHIIGGLSKVNNYEKTFNAIKNRNFNIIVNNSILDKIYHIDQVPYFLKPYINKKSIDALKKIKSITNKNDLIITWWDQSYPIWFYSNLNTIIDGSKHRGDAFLVSKILLSNNSLLSYNLINKINDVYLKLLSDKNKTKFFNNTIVNKIFIKDNKILDVEKILKNMSIKKELYKHKNNIYLILFRRQFDILAGIDLFSNRNINTGEKYKTHFFTSGPTFKINNDLYILTEPSKYLLKLNKNNYTFNVLNKKKLKIKIKKVIVLSYDNKNHKWISNVKQYNKNGINFVFFKDTKQSFLIDDFYYNSLYFQMMFLDKYDNNLYTPVILTKDIKMYKINSQTKKK